MLYQLSYAREARILDMCSSPYDVSSLGYENVPIETPDGKAEHVRRQRAIEQRSRPLRERLIRTLEVLSTGSRTVRNSTADGRDELLHPQVVPADAG